MKRFVFGLSNCKTRSWVEERWKKYRKKDLDGFVTDVLSNEGEHILPLLSGDKKTLSLMRKRYLENLGQVLSQKEIRKILKTEMKIVLKRIEA
jgi:hypothetical protein